MDPSMSREPLTRVSPYVSLLVGAIGAFIFFGILSGALPRGDAPLQMATPPTLTPENR